jgi:hypothetical protein
MSQAQFTLFAFCLYQHAEDTTSGYALSVRKAPTDVGETDIAPWPGIRLHPTVTLHINYRQ